MSRQGTKVDPKKVNSELVSLTYGALVVQLVKDLETSEEVNRQLDRMGYNIGIRLIEDFLAKSGSGRCLDLRDTADKIQLGFRMFLGVAVGVGGWNAAGDEFSITIDSNPLTEQVELPDELRTSLKYCALLCGVIRGALEMVQLEVQCWISADQLKGDANTEIRVKFIRKLEDAVPAGEE